MSVSALFTGGWLCDPFGASSTVLISQGLATGHINQKTTLEGVFLSQIPLFGDILQTTPFFGDLNVQIPSFGNVALSSSLYGLLYLNGDYMSNISLKRGDSRNLEITVLSAPKRLEGSWVWDATSIVKSTNTTGLAIGDWLRSPSDPERFFEVSAINTDVSVAILNPFGVVIPNDKKADFSTAIDLTNAVVRSSIRHKKTDKEITIKHSYDASEIQVTNATAGKAVIKLRIDDTIDQPFGKYVWGTEVTRKGTLATSAGTLSFTANSDIITVTNGDFSKIRKGQILEPTGTNTQRALITDTDTTNNTITTSGFLNWVSETGATFSLFEGDRDSPDGLSGDFDLLKDTTR